MCYSARIQSQVKKWMRRNIFAADFSYDDITPIFERRMTDASIRIPRAFEDNFITAENADDLRIKELIEGYRAKVQDEWIKDLFAQRQRQADAQQKLAIKPTKSAQESLRISTTKIETLQRKLDDLKATAPKPDDARIYPMYYAPIVVNEGGGNSIVLARYHCRQQGKAESEDRRYPGLYNARSESLDEYWRPTFGHNHAIIVIDRFYENVERNGKNAVLEFAPRGADEMIVACLFSRWSKGNDELLSFAAITQEPPQEVRDAGHDRMIVNLKPENVQAWLTPKGRSMGDLREILTDVERPYYEHKDAA